MNAFRSDLMVEATRLTRAGRLPEATALLQRAFSGSPERGTDPGPPRSSAASVSTQRAGRVIDIDPATGEALGSAPAPPAGDMNAYSTGPQRAGVRVGLVPAALPDALRRVVGRLKEAGLEAGRPAQRQVAPEPLPDGAAFTTHAFSNDAGSRTYKLYVPVHRSGGAPALIVMLHGCTQSPDDFAAGTRMNALAEEHGFLVAYPAQAPSANAQKCWNWFSPADQRRGTGEPALIAGITRQVMRDHRVDAGRVYVAGLSAGGAAAAIMGMAYPDLYAAVGVHSGLACGAAQDVASAFAAMRQGASARHPSPAGPHGLVPTIVFHADGDRTVHPSNGDQVIAQCAAASPQSLRTVLERGQVPGGHAYSRTVHQDASGRVLLEQWLVHGGGHAWSGGSAAGSYTDPAGPDASREMVRFFLSHRLTGSCA